MRYMYKYLLIIKQFTKNLQKIKATELWVRACGLWVPLARQASATKS